jgi:hypothetical protein
MIEKHAMTLADVLTLVKEILNEWEPTHEKGGHDDIWFRGQPEAQLPLLPGLYRNSMVRLHYDEPDLFNRFMARGTPLAPSLVRTDWDWYFLSQHHGIPTRLLDWTENVIAAVYFAVEPYIKVEDRREYDVSRKTASAVSVYDEQSPVIWMLDPGTLNQFACGESAYYVISPRGDLTQQYLPSQIGSASPANRHPLAIVPSYTNHRIAAQQGVFTVHGHDRRSIDSLARTQDEGIIRIAQIRLDRANIPLLWEQLELSGMNRMALFPDLDAVAQYTKWNCQYA